MTDLNVPLGSLQEGNGSRGILVCDRCVGPQGELLALIELHGVEVLVGHGRIERYEPVKSVDRRYVLYVVRRAMLSL